MSVHLAAIGNAFQFFNANGKPLANGLLYTFGAGTSTPATTYTDNTGIPTNTNPIVLNPDGRLPNEVWLTDGTAYKFVLKTSGAVTLGTYDNIIGINDQTGLATLAALASTTPPTGASLVGFKQTVTGAVARTVQTKLQETVSLQDYGAVGDGTTDNLAAINAAITALGATGGEILVPAGTFAFSSSINLPSNCTLRGVANGASKIKNTGAISPNNIAIDVRGAVGTAYAINATTEGDASVTTTVAANAGNFAANDFIALAGPFTLGDYYPFFVTKVTGANAGTGVITLAEKVLLTGGYTQVLKVTTLMENVTIRDLEISQATDVAIQIKYTRKVTIQNVVDARTAGTTGVSVVGSRDMTIADNFFARGMGFHSMMYSEVRNNTSYTGLQTTVEAGCMHNAFIANSLQGMTANGFGSQTQSQRNRYIGNVISNVPNLGCGFQILADAGFGGGNVIVGNVITGGGAGDYGVAIGAGANGNVVTGNTIIGCDNGVASSESALALGVNSFVSCTANVTGAGTIQGLIGVSAISGTGVFSKNLRGTATFTGAATKVVAFAAAEPDTTYYVTITGNANETFWVTTKTVNGFTLNSSNAGSLAAIEWHVLR